MNDRDLIQTRCLGFCSCFSFWITYIWFDYAFKSWALICQSSWQPFTDILCSEINESSEGSLTPEWRQKDGNGLSQLPPVNSWMSLLKWEPKILSWSTPEKVTVIEWLSKSDQQFPILKSVEKVIAAIFSVVVNWYIYMMNCHISKKAPSYNQRGLTLIKWEYRKYVQKDNFKIVSLSFILFKTQ